MRGGLGRITREVAFIVRAAGGTARGAAGRTARGAAGGTAGGTVAAERAAATERAAAVVPA